MPLQLNRPHVPGCRLPGCPNSWPELHKNVRWGKVTLEGPRAKHNLRVFVSVTQVSLEEQKRMKECCLFIPRFRAVRNAQHLSALAALAGDQNLVPNTLIRWLTTISNPSTKGNQTPPSAFPRNPTHR